MLTPVPPEANVIPRALLAAILVLLAATAAPAQPVPVLFDTDIGTDIDDAYALALILRSPELELLGVTTVSGDAVARARLAAKLLALEAARRRACPSTPARRPRRST